MFCSTFSLMGLLGAFYIIVATISVAWQLRLAAPQKLPEYLHNSAVLIVLLAFGTGLGGALRFLGSMNTAFWGTYWAYETQRTNECFVSAYLMQFSLWMEMGASLFMAVCYYQLSGPGSASSISARACWSYVAATVLSSIFMSIVPVYVGSGDNRTGAEIPGAYDNLTVWCWIEEPIHQWSLYYGWCLAFAIVMIVLLGMACYRDSRLHGLRRRRHGAGAGAAGKLPAFPHQRIRCRLLTFIIVWMVVRITGWAQALDSLYGVDGGGAELHSLLLLHASVGSMMGGVDAIVYSVTSSGMRHFFTSLQFRMEQTRLLSSRLKPGRMDVGMGHTSRISAGRGDLNGTEGTRMREQSMPGNLRARELSMARTNPLQRGHDSIDSARSDDDAYPVVDGLPRQEIAPANFTRGDHENADTMRATSPIGIGHEGMPVSGTGEVRGSMVMSVDEGMRGSAAHSVPSTSAHPMLSLRESSHSENLSASAAHGEAKSLQASLLHVCRYS